MGSRVPVPEPGSSTPSFSLTKTKHPVTTMADQKELEEAFKLFDADGDGLITSVELKALVEKVGGCMSEGEAQGLIHQADRDGNAAIDMSEFTKLWAAIRGDGQEEDVIRTEFRKIDKDNSGFITKDEMMSIKPVVEPSWGMQWLKHRNALLSWMLTRTVESPTQSSSWSTNTRRRKVGKPSPGLART